jgi:uncharacterized protein (UPF0264 family)
MLGERDPIACGEAPRWASGPERFARTDRYRGLSVVPTEQLERIMAISLNPLALSGEFRPLGPFFLKSMSSRTTETPRLLVSVRSTVEAQAALAGGCDLIDVKEPQRGSLGAAEETTIAAVCALVEGRCPVSVALGELVEWPAERLAFRLPAEVAFAKVGLSGCPVNWSDDWMRLRERFDAAAGRPVGWVAVYYADMAAAGPSVEEVIELAATTGCRGVLVDTWSKEGHRLFDHVRPSELGAWRRAVSEAGLLFAVAGSLQRAEFPRLKPIAPDIVAVRGAACRGGHRTGEVCEEAVQQLRTALRCGADGVSVSAGIV